MSGQEEVSFHMSGTEAVMAAVRLVRFNTRKKLIVCFSGAYHGWWDGVQPGLGSERRISDCLTLKDLHPAALDLAYRAARAGWERWLVPDAVVRHAYAAVIDKRFFSRHTLWHARGMARFVRKPGFAALRGG